MSDQELAPNGFKIPKKYKGGELPKKRSFLNMLSIFFEKPVRPGKDFDDESDCIWSEYNLGNRFRADAFIQFQGNGIIFEYDGPDHYINTFKMETDERKNKLIEDQGLKYYRFPYYLQLTKDVAKFFFEDKFDLYTDKKFKECLKQIYKTDDEKNILAPGFHTTMHTPANFISKGFDRFLKEIDYLPSSVKSQVVHSLNLYIKRSNGRAHMIVPDWHQKFILLMKHKPNPEDLGYFFSSEV